VSHLSKIDLTITTGHKTIPLDNRLFSIIPNTVTFIAKHTGALQNIFLVLCVFLILPAFRIKSIHFRIKAGQAIALKGKFVLYNFIDE